MTSSPSIDRHADPSVGSWLFALALGLASIGVGIALLFRPADSLPTLAVITGIFVFVDGLAGIVLMLLADREERPFVAVLAVLDIAVGVLLVRHPARGVEVIALLLGIWLIATGVIRALSATTLGAPNLWRVLTGAVLLIAGIVIVADPGIGYRTLALIAGIGFIAYGLALVGGELDRHYLHSPAGRPAGPRTAA